MLGTLEAGLVEGIDAPRVHRAIAEGCADRVHGLRDQEEHISVREEIQTEGEATQDAAHHEAPAPTERIGEGARGHVEEESHGEVHGEHAVDLELVEAARPEEERIHAAQESARQRVGEPDAVVATHDAVRRKRRARSSHRDSGSVKVNVEPAPSWLVTQILPPWSSMNFRERASPSPVPSAFLSAVPTWRNSSNTAA